MTTTSSAQIASEKFEYRRVTPLAPYLSVVVPARNESKRLPTTISKLRNELAALGISWEIIVVDDGSIDDTELVATNEESKVVRHAQSRGIAASMRTGSAVASGVVVMTCPADVMDFSFLKEALDASRHFDIVSVSKRHPDSVVEGYGAWRWFLSNSYQFAVRLLFRIPNDLTDTHYIKVFRRDKLLRVISRSSIDGPVGETEIIMRLVRNGASWREIPARIIHQRNQSKTTFWLVLRTFRELIQLLSLEMSDRKK